MEAAEAEAWSSESELSTLARKSTCTAVSKSQKGSSTALMVGGNGGEEGEEEGEALRSELLVAAAAVEAASDPLGASAAAAAAFAAAVALPAAAAAAAVAESGGSPGPATAPFSSPVGESHELACHRSNSLLASSTETWKGTTRGWRTPRR